jgi:pilus assembly protein CpaE
LAFADHGFPEGIPADADFQHMRADRGATAHEGQKTSTERREARGKLIALVSDKGGAGTSTVAANLAIQLTRAQRSVCLVELARPAGSVSEFLGLPDTDSMHAVVKALRCGQLRSLDGLLIEHDSGMRVLAEAAAHGVPVPPRPAEMDEIFDRLMQSFDLLVVDAPKQFDDMQLLVLDRAELILFVTEPAVPALRSARRTFDVLHRTGVDTAKIRVLLNRFVMLENLNPKTVERIVGCPVFWTIPDDYPAVVAAVNRGVPLAVSDGKPEIAERYAGLAKALLELI